MKKTPTFLPTEYKTTEERYQDIERRNKKIEEELFSIMNAWANFKSELYKIEKNEKKKDNLVYAICGGAIICSILLLILEWSK